LGRFFLFLFFLRRRRKRILRKSKRRGQRIERLPNAAVVPKLEHSHWIALIPQQHVRVLQRFEEFVHFVRRPLPAFAQPVERVDQFIGIDIHLAAVRGHAGLAEICPAEQVHQRFGSRKPLRIL